MVILFYLFNITYLSNIFERHEEIRKFLSVSSTVVEYYDCKPLHNYLYKN